jgi:hypothetical protein
VTSYGRQYFIESPVAACLKMVSLVEKKKPSVLKKKKVQVNFRTPLALTPFNLLNTTCGIYQNINHKSFF